LQSFSELTDLNLYLCRVSSDSEYAQRQIRFRSVSLTSWQKPLQLSRT